MLQSVKSQFPLCALLMAQTFGCHELVFGNGCSADSAKARHYFYDSTMVALCEAKRSSLLRNSIRQLANRGSSKSL